MRARSLMLILATWGICHGPASASDNRWPVWPTEVDRVAAPLHVIGPKLPDERRRVDAVHALDRFATPAIAHQLVAGLDDPSSQVRRELLRLCYERTVKACVPAAAVLWTEGPDPSVRLAALKVMAIDPAPSRAAILLDALRDPNSEIRAGAASYLGWAPLAPAARARARSLLLAKLSDVSSNVRKRVLASLGLMGPGKGTLAVARLLEDPEPSVRTAAAEALGRFDDARAVPALTRALASGNEAPVARAVVVALAGLPGSAVDKQLLELLDDPPRGLSADHVAQAIGRRPHPDRVLLDGLVERLREESLRGSVLSALLLLGKRARPALVEAVRRGLDPQLEVEVERLVAAVRPPKPAVPFEAPWPAAGDRRAWHRLLSSGTRARRMAAALALAELAPEWLDDGLAGALMLQHDPSSAHAWLVLVARSARPVLRDRDHRRVWTRLVGWARDEARARADRCMAVAALGAAGTGPAARMVKSQLLVLREARSAPVRACSVLALARHPRSSAAIEAMLLDPDERVRVSAAFALAVQKPDSLGVGARSRLALQRERDGSAGARWAAAIASAGLIAKGSRSTRPTWIEAEGPGGSWVRLELDGRPVAVPAHRVGSTRWALVPGLDTAEVVENRDQTPSGPKIRPTR